MTHATDDHAVAAVDARARTRLRGMVRLARPRQWTKNSLLLAAPTAASVLHRPAVLASVLGGIALFCLAASGAYFINDALDVEADRAHPRKRLRPIASGTVGAREALVGGLVMIVTAIAAAVTIMPAAFTLTIATYAMLTLAYSRWLKHVPLVEMIVVASGFVLRAMAGGYAAEVPLSEWFLMVATFGALFIVVGKRHAEVVALGDVRASHRAVLANYTVPLTQHLMTVAASVTLVGYGLWTFSVQDLGGMTAPWPALSVLPFVYALSRYAMLTFSGHGGEPEELALGDRGLQVAGLVWALLLGIGVYI